MQNIRISSKEFFHFKSEGNKLYDSNDLPNLNLALTNYN